jgi:predicted regulator of Ras-like GTPase activity (Roadblock/LC7/MglB family)
MLTDKIKALLLALNGSSADIEGSAIVSRDGLPVASALAQGMDEDRVSAMVAAVLSLGERMSSELSRGELDQVMVSGKMGHVLIIQAGNETVLCAVAKKAVLLGMLFLEANRCAKTISGLLV